MEHYGELSKRKLEDQQAGARIAVEAHKKSPADFVLWKESAADQPGWAAAFTVDGETVSIYGRPGWHIECSAMSDRFLWEEIKDRLSPKAKARPHQFDIHGGGLDLIFPHHENEIAQSCCAFDTGVMANIWMHNGFLQVEGKKMSKSEGNFVTINELLETEKFGGRKWQGKVLRLAMLKTHYLEPIDWSVRNLAEARQDMFDFASALENFEKSMRSRYKEYKDTNAARGGEELSEQAFVDRFFLDEEVDVASEFIRALSEDLNTPVALMKLKELSKSAESSFEKAAILMLTLQKFGILKFDELEFYRSGFLLDPDIGGADAYQVMRHKAEEIRVARANNTFSDSLLSFPLSADVRVVELEKGLVSFRLVDEATSIAKIKKIVDARLEHIKAKNWAEADRIRDELLEKGIQLKDGKDPATGERITTWEVKR